MSPRLRWFLRDRRGIAASEFALTLPILLLLLVGTIEIGNLVLLDRKITAAAMTAADLVAQERTIDAQGVTNVWNAVDNIIAPFSTSGTVYGLASVVANSGGVTSVDWQQMRGAIPTGVVVLPPNLVGPNESVIVATVRYDYTPVFVGLLLGSFTIDERAYLRPRTVSRVLYQ